MSRSRPQGAAPMRTCVGCRQRDQKDQLLRLAVVAGSVVVDPRRRLPGRGAYVHAGGPASCVVRAAHGGISRALRVAFDRDAAVELQRAVARAAEENGGETCQAEVQAR